MNVYLDYNASAPVDERVVDMMIDVYKNHVGNADSRTHIFGEKARNIVEKARKQVANLLRIMPDEVFFTSGATESNNIAILGLKEYAYKIGKKHIITTAVEHKSVLESVRQLEIEGFEVEIISPSSSGAISVEDVMESIRADTLLVSVMHANNETGVIQPVKKIGERLQSEKILFHIDATQSCGKLVDEIRELQYDMLSFSAHKLMGPQGVGCLVLRKKNYKFPPIKSIMYGGQQEHGIRPGTTPVALVAGCGLACEIAEKEYKQNREYYKKIKIELIDLLKRSGIDYHVNGDLGRCLLNTLNICITGVSAEALMISIKKFCSISNGSACNSKSYSPSYVLAAMGISGEEIDNSIRISWGRYTDMDVMIRNFEEVLKVAKSIKN